MLRLLNNFIPIFLLLLAICLPAQIATKDKYRPQQIDFSYATSDSLAVQQPTHLKDKIRQSDLCGFYQLRSFTLISTYKSQNHFSNLLGLKSQFGRHYPSGPSPPRSI